jgi:hypothetical protein
MHPLTKLSPPGNLLVLAFQTFFTIFFKKRNFLLLLLRLHGIEDPDNKAGTILMDGLPGSPRKLQGKPPI